MPRGIFKRTKGVNWFPTQGFQKGHPNYLKGGRPISEDASYVAIHVWVKSKKGKPEKCIDCGKLNEKRGYVHWANKDHKYSRNLDDYIALCPKCHKKRDMENGLSKQ